MIFKYQYDNKKTLIQSTCIYGHQFNYTLYSQVVSWIDVLFNPRQDIFPDIPLNSVFHCRKCKKYDNLILFQSLNICYKMNNTDGINFLSRCYFVLNQWNSVFIDFMKFSLGSETYYTLSPLVFGYFYWKLFPLRYEWTFRVLVYLCTRQSGYGLTRYQSTACTYFCLFVC